VESAFKRPNHWILQLTTKNRVSNAVTEV